MRENLQGPEEGKQPYDIDKLWDQLVKPAVPGTVYPYETLTKAYHVVSNQSGRCSAPTTGEQNEALDALEQKFKRTISESTIDSMLYPQLVIAGIFLHERLVIRPKAGEEIYSVLAEIRNSDGQSLICTGRSSQLFTNGPVFLRVISAHDKTNALYYYWVHYSKEAFEEELKTLQHAGKNNKDGKLQLYHMVGAICREAATKFGVSQIDSQKLLSCEYVPSRDVPTFLVKTAHGNCLARVVRDPMSCLLRIKADVVK